MKLVDFNNILYIRTFSLKSRGELDKHNLFSDVIKSLRYFDEDIDAKYGRLIICCDSKSNWRKDYFKNYKIKRKEAREESDIDWNEMFAWWAELKEIIKTNTTWPLIEIEKLEGDDIIGLICQLTKPEKHLIISSDKDFNQLLKKYWIFQFSPLSMQEIERDDLKLKTLILKGDASDGVPNIFCDDDWFIKEDKPRAKSISKKLIEEINLSSEHYVRNYLLQANVFKEDDSEKLNRLVESTVNNYKRNKLMVDLSEIPIEYHQIFKKEFIKAINIANQIQPTKQIQLFNEWI